MRALVMRGRHLPLFFFLLPAIAAAPFPTLAQSASSSTPASASANSSQLTVSGDVAKPLTLALADLDQMPQKTLALSPRDGKPQSYQGVLLSELLNRAGAPQGGKLKGPAMATYVVAEGSDGYRVTFSIAELDTDFQDSQVLVADKLNGDPLGEVGPFRLIVPQDKRPARWVRNLRSLKVVTLPASK